MSLDLLKVNIVLSNFSSSYVLVELKGPNAIGREMALTSA
jgi:hypothetical protein